MVNLDRDSTLYEDSCAHPLVGFANQAHMGAQQLHAVMFS